MKNDTMPAPADEGKITIYPNGHGGYYLKQSPSYLNVPLGATNGRDAMENAQLFADAYETKRETGLTPRQLADQRAELLDVVKICAARLSDIPAFGDEIGDKVSKAQLGCALKACRAAIAKCQREGGAA